jgi:hypothetical protein
VLNARYAGAANSSQTQTALAMFGGGVSAGASGSGAAVSPAVGSAVYLSTFPDVHAAQAASSANADAGGHSQQNDPMFRSLFQADEGAPAVSPTVQALWGNSSSLTSNAASGNTTSGNTSAPAPLDLFSDRNGTFSG